MDKDQAKELLIKYNAGTCSEEERAIMESWYNQLEYLTDAPEAGKIIAAKDQVWASLTAGQPKEQRVRVLWPRIAVAASILLFICISGYFVLFTKSNPPIARDQATEIKPGGNKAVLTLPNGKNVILNDVRNGLVAQQAHTSIDKADSGALVYTSQASGGGTPIVYDMLTIPRGGQYRVKLADGSVAWLNSETRLRYPESFTGNERKVELLSGEAYFEVAHDAAKPFTVVVKGQTIEVLGTHFNINAYDDEPVIKTTLLEGSIKVSGNGKSALLKPGQQSVTRPGDPSLLVRNADTEEAIAWKEGHFHFEGSDIKTVMRQLARWYDVDVQYSGQIPVREFSGDIDRNSKVSVALQILSISKVHFKIEGRRIIIMP